DGLTTSTMLTVAQPVITSISVSPANTSIFIGKTQQLTATGTFSDGSSRDVTSTASWSVLNPATASISATGLLTPIAFGQTNVEAYSPPVAGFASVTVNFPVLTSISVSPSIASLAIGSTQQFTATGTYSDGSQRDLTSNVLWNNIDVGANMGPGAA